MHFIPLTEFDFHHVLGETQGACLVMFTSPDCGTCRRIEQLLPTISPPIVTGLYKVDVQQATAMARQYDIFHLPTLFLYYNGQFHAKVECEVTPTKLKETIERALAEPAEEEP